MRRKPSQTSFAELSYELCLQHKVHYVSWATEVSSAADATSLQAKNCKQNQPTFLRSVVVRSTSMERQWICPDKENRISQRNMYYWVKACILEDTEALLVAGKETSLDANAEKTKHMSKFRQ